MEPIRKTAHSPPIGYVIGEHRFFTVSEGARMIGEDLINPTSLWKYAMAGETPFGVKLEVIRQPLLRTDRGHPVSDRQHRLLLREDQILLIRDVFFECRDGRGWITQEMQANMQDAANRRFRARRPTPVISPKSDSVGRRQP